MGHSEFPPAEIDWDSGGVGHSILTVKKNSLVGILLLG